MIFEIYMIAIFGKQKHRMHFQNDRNNLMFECIENYAIISMQMK